MEVGFKYGLKGQSIVHVRDLNPEVDRGLSCACTCIGCGRQLVANMGKVYEWCFKHAASSDDAGCTLPAPMTLLHRFAQQQLARLDTFRPPRSLHMHAPAAQGALKVLSARTEAPLGPRRRSDVELRTNGGVFAVEVTVTHGIDDAKQRDIDEVNMNVLEFNLAGLYVADVNAGALARLIADDSLWIWRRRIAARTTTQPSWRDSVWSPASPWKTPDRIKQRALNHLRIAASHMKRMKSALDQQAQVARAEPNAGTVMSNWLFSLEREEVLAVACCELNLDPQDLPAFLEQNLPRGRIGKPWQWQPALFMKFGFGRNGFTSLQAEQWLTQSVRLEGVEDWGRTQNGFSRTRAAIHSFLVNLCAQGFLDRESSPKGTTDEIFVPRYRRRAEFGGHLICTETGRAAEGLLCLSLRGA